MTKSRDNHRRSAISIRLPAALHAELTQAAAERDLSVNYLVDAAVRDFLPRLIPADEFSLTRNEGATS